MQAAIEARYPAANYSYDELEELVLDGCKIKKISKEDGVFLSQFKTLTSLSCSRTGLVSIENFPVLPTLTVLILLDNSLSTTQSHLDTLSTCTPNLRVLQLAGNRLNDIHLFIQYLVRCKSVF
jgi:acidic leucine-rich nuclear phosphoprotein 32 family member B